MYKINQVLPNPSDWSGNLELPLFFPLTISVPDKGVSYPPGTVLEFLHISCIIAIFERYHSSIKYITSMYHDKASKDAKYD